MPPCTWSDDAAHAPAGVRRVRLRHRRGQLGSDSGSASAVQRRVVGRRARALDLEQHLRAAVRHGLVGADRRGRTACGRARTRRPSPSPAAPRRSARPRRASQRSGRPAAQQSPLERLAAVGAHAREAARAVHRRRAARRRRPSARRRGRRRRRRSARSPRRSSASGHEPRLAVAHACPPCRAPRRTRCRAASARFCSSEPADWSTSPAAAFERNGTGASA